MRLLTDNEQVTPTLEDASESYKLMTGYMEADEEKTFELRLWMDENITMENTDAMNKTFASKITVVATYAKEAKKTLEETILAIEPETEDSGNSGIYKVTHDNANITYTTDPFYQNRLKQIEYRYAGNNPNNYVDVGERYVTDTYGFFYQDKYEFDTKDKCESDRSESLHYVSEATECISTPNTEGLFMLEYKDSEEDDFSYINSYSTIDECQSAKEEYVSWGENIIQDCFQPENIYSYTAISQESTDYSSNDECELDYESEIAEGYGICKVAHLAGEPIYWQIIGLVNTPEGQRVKIVRNTSIGDFSWDTSASNISNGWGVNEWSQSDLMKLLNEGYGENQLEDSEGVTQDTYVNNSLYWNGGKGQCYDSSRNSASPCDFTNDKMPDSLKIMIDTITWNIGNNGNEHDYNNIKVNEFYNLERSNNTWKICDSDYSSCNDEVKREISWQGKVGLIYPSDLGYATSGGTETSRTMCLGKSEDNIVMFNWDNYNDCYDNDWLFLGAYYWTLSPSDEVSVFYIDGEGYVHHYHTSNAYDVFPSVYLKSNVLVAQGDGQKNSPYILEY